MTQIICITCPKGCHLSVDEQNGYERVVFVGQGPGALLALLAALDAAGLTDRVDAIHLDDLSRLTMDYAGRFSVEMEYNADYDRMLQILEAGISKLESNQTGSIRLDLNPPILTLD